MPHSLSTIDGLAEVKYQVFIVENWLILDDQVDLYGQAITVQYLSSSTSP